MTKGPWRRGGQCKLPTGSAAEFVELETGTDIWGADGPVTMLEDWFDDEDIDLMAKAPEMRDRIATLEIENAALKAKVDFGHCPRPDDIECASTCAENAALRRKLDEATVALRRIGQVDNDTGNVRDEICAECRGYLELLSDDDDGPACEADCPGFVARAALAGLTSGGKGAGDEWPPPYHAQLCTGAGCTECARLATPAPASPDESATPKCKPMCGDSVSEERWFCSPACRTAGRSLNPTEDP
jgi:hypothetical protein